MVLKAAVAGGEWKEDAIVEVTAGEFDISKMASTISSVQTTKEEITSKFVGKPVMGGKILLRITYPPEEQGEEPFVWEGKTVIVGTQNYEDGYIFKFDLISDPSTFDTIRLGDYDGLPLYRDLPLNTFVFKRIPADGGVVAVVFFGNNHPQTGYIAEAYPYVTIATFPYDNSTH